MRYALLMILLLGFGRLNAQDREVKSEREERIRSEAVPSGALEWLSGAFPQVKKVKWYAEETSGKQSYEAKFRHNGSRYSVEFSIRGIVEDVEVQVAWNQLSDSVQKSLKRTFDQLEKFRPGKIQEQWTASSPEALRSAILNRTGEGLTVRYEIEFKAEIDGQHALWEGTFDDSGRLIGKRRILLRPTDNLDF